MRTGLAFNNEHTALFVANTAQDTIVKVPVSGSPLEAGTPEVFVNRAAVDLTASSSTNATTTCWSPTSRQTSAL
jgi:hypothetical protein